MYYKNVFFLLFLVQVSISSCSKKEKKVDTDPIETFKEVDYRVDNLPIDNSLFYDAENRGILQNTQLDEASGLAVSRSMPGVLYSHNDSGDHNRIFLVGADSAQNFGTFRLLGSGNRDWEDMCIGPGPETGKNYLYVGDIGDNNAIHPCVFIYRFFEPTFDLSAGPLVNTNYGPDNVERFPLVYPDGPRDAETLMIDPITKDLFIISKRDFRSSVYRVAAETLKNNDTLKPTKILELPFNWATAGDISADGLEILVKTTDRLYYWTRNASESILNAMLRQPKRLNYIEEMQGEAIAWAPDGSGFYTCSESRSNQPVPLFWYQRI